MKILKSMGPKLLIVAAMFAVGAYFYSSLPAELPVHWNVHGEVDNYMAKEKATFMFPFIALALVLLFPVFKYIDPRKKKYENFQKVWEIIQYMLLVFFAYLYFVTIYISLNPEYSVNNFVFLGVGLLFIVLGNYMGKIRTNYFVGIKTPWTLEDEDVWNKTHRFGGWMFVIGGLLMILSIFIPSMTMIFFVTAVILSAVVPVGYSYYLFRVKSKE